MDKPLLERIAEEFPLPWSVSIEVGEWNADRGDPTRILDSREQTIIDNIVYYPSPLPPMLANLFAAAPDMLAALEGLVEDFSSMSRYGDEPSLISARAAIAKAKGGAA